MEPLFITELKKTIYQRLVLLFQESPSYAVLDEHAICDAIDHPVMLDGVKYVLTVHPKGTQPWDVEVSYLDPDCDSDYTCRTFKLFTLSTSEIKAKADKAFHKLYGAEDDGVDFSSKDGRVIQILVAGALRPVPYAKPTFFEINQLLHTAANRMMDIIRQNIYYLNNKKGSTHGVDAFDPAIKSQLEHYVQSEPFKLPFNYTYTTKGLLLSGTITVKATLGANEASVAYEWGTVNRVND